jgi:flagellar protein FlaG
MTSLDIQTGMDPQTNTNGLSQELTQDSNVVNETRVYKNTDVKPEREQELAGLSEELNNQKEEELTKEQLNEMAQSLQDFVKSFNRSLEFSVDDETNRNVITVKDADSGDVVRQIPSQEMLDLIKSLGKTTGVLFNENV